MKRICIGIVAVIVLMSMAHNTAIAQSMSNFENSGSIPPAVSFVSADAHR
jgi:hypothetical protein